MLHNRQLLPFANHTCGSSGRYQQATASLRAEWHRLAHNAAGAQCDGLSTLRFELQLSGFFSMMSSVLKPWTAAIRLGRSFLTPSAHGLISRRLCTARDLSCFFKPLGPDRCQPAPLWVRYNLPQQTRESLTSGMMLPRAYRHLGLFWWAAQLYARLMQPNAHLQRQLKSALEVSGLQAALDSGETVAGFHVRHGDSCMKSEVSRTVRQCEPFSVYLARVRPYLKSIGCTTLFIATDSESVLRDATTHGLRILYLRNVSRSGLTTPLPSRVIDEVLRERAANGREIETSHHEAALAALDAHLLAQTHLLVGKFTSSLFRLAYALAAARRQALVPFVSLDAPWCSDHSIRAGYNDNFPNRASLTTTSSDQLERTRGANLNSESNTFLC
ncbi:MAG: hypothetical protein SGPRY_005975 [Prymnesium sp.]